MKTLPPIFPNQVCPTPLSSLSPPTPNSTALSAVVFLWLNEWSCHISYAILLNDIMDLHMSSLGTLRALALLYLVPEEPQPSELRSAFGNADHVADQLLLSVGKILPTLFLKKLLCFTHRRLFTHERDSVILPLVHRFYDTKESFSLLQLPF